ncbi:hypothetical protein NEL76_11280, partial [Escherichia coli]|nr:hypothetical protein [Escherichia coli]MDI0953339.1 hypothetical protein [Escherichia coli]
IICSPMTSLKTSIKTITYLSDIGCLEIQGASLARIPPLRHTREEVDMVVAGQQRSWIDCCITQPR